MRRTSSRLTGGLPLLLLPLLLLHNIAGIIVELSEIQQVDDAVAVGTYDASDTFFFSDDFDGVDPIDSDCPNAGKCIGPLTRDGSLELDSRYGCTDLFRPSSDDGFFRNVCLVSYGLSTSISETSTIASVRVALHPDSTTTLTVRTNRDTVVVEEWEATPGSTELQEIAGLDGLETDEFSIMGVFGAGDYLGILEVEIYVNVDEVPVNGTSASTRTTVSATAATDASSAMNTLDGDATDSSSWTCSSGEVCEITYDLQATESLEQLRIAFSESSDAGGELNFMAAGESGIFSSVRTGVEAGGRPVGDDGLQTYGGVRALARYVKIEVIPPSGGSIVINEVEFRVGDHAPTRPVEEKKWLKPTGPLPLASNYDDDYRASDELAYDIRAASDGGCDSPGHFEGCQAYYVKDGDLDSRWTCGPLAAGNRLFPSEDCEMAIDLHIFRYVRQIQIAFHMGDEQHDEFSIEALTATGWVRVVASAITSGDTADYQTFDVGVHARVINVVPKFQRFNQWFSIKEIIVLEKRNNAFIAGTVPVSSFFGSSNEASDDEPPTRFAFDIPDADSSVRVIGRSSTVTALRMRFPADREFVFEVYVSLFNEDNFVQTFTSAGGDNVWETFTLSEPQDFVLIITAISGPTFANKPDYPALRVVDFQVLGEAEENDPGYFNMVSTTVMVWDTNPDIIGDGVSEQQTIMTAICETKGATYDGTDCVGELDDSAVHIDLEAGQYFLDGPVFMKSGVTLEGTFLYEEDEYTDFILYDGDNNGNTAEEGIIIINDVTGARVDTINLQRKTDWTGDIVPGTVGNLCLDVRNSKEIEIYDLIPGACRTGAARFTDSSNITAFKFLESNQEIGNYAELTRVDDFDLDVFGDVGGLLIDTCNNIVWRGASGDDLPDPNLSPRIDGDEMASVVITGNSSNVVLKDFDIVPGPEPRILMESILPLTLDNLFKYEDVPSGVCVVQVPAGTTDDLIVVVNSDHTLSKSGDCWVFD